MYSFNVNHIDRLFVSTTFAIGSSSIYSRKYAKNFVYLFLTFGLLIYKKTKDIGYL